MKTAAAIDIGSNTILLLVARIKKGVVETVEEQQHLPRLGHGVDENGRLDDERMQRAVAILQSYRNHVKEQYGADVPIFATATSAVRDASNREDFLTMIKEEVGLDVELVSGVEEARRTFSGAVGMLKEHDHQPHLVVDIGGGSTEVAWGKGLELRHRHSFDMGSVRFTERFLPGNPPETEEMDACRNVVARMLAEHPVDIDEQTGLLGVAGTVTSLAAMQNDLEKYSSEAVNGFVLTVKMLRDWIKCFSTFPHEEMLHRYPQVMEGRSDVFLAGLLILEGVMEHVGRDELTVSTGGIRHGTLLHYQNEIMQK